MWRPIVLNVSLLEQRPARTHPQAIARDLTRSPGRCNDPHQPTHAVKSARRAQRLNPVGEAPHKEKQQQHKHPKQITNQEGTGEVVRIFPNSNGGTLILLHQPMQQPVTMSPCHMHPCLVVLLITMLCLRVRSSYASFSWACLLTMLFESAIH